MKRKIILCLMCVWTYCASAQQVTPVKVYEGQEIIPTYKKGADETSPIFYTGRGVQGAAGHFYPYPAQINLGDTLTMESYDMVYLENEYIKVSILPAFGGKLFSAIDKTNGHELFHRNSTVKPDLIGTLGAWVSGGIEWCFPHHHRPTTMLPADYFTVQNADGSATVWVGETERMLGLRAVIGITVYPERSYIETVYYLNNPSDITRNSLFWANVAVTANEHFRTFWPPSQEIGVFHNNSGFVHWPVGTGRYSGVDYKDVDLTWWKNHPKPVSIFFWQGKEGFIGGYDYSQKAGTVHVGDVYNNRTSKLWQFGPGLEGQNARRKLTDDGKAYVELMTGSFSNNQPDYNWFAPHSVKEALNYWYPVREIEVVKNANTEASLTLQMRDAKTVMYGFNTTRRFAKARALLKYGDETLVDRQINIDPSKPFVATWKSKTDLDEYQLYLELQDGEGRQLIAYRPYRLQHPPLPEKHAEPKQAKEIESVEDLYLAGRFVEQFSRPNRNPDDYYLEALRKSPDDYRSNIAMGIRRVNQWRYAEAEQYLQKAANKLRVAYIQPKEGELFYYLALAQKGQGKLEEAYRNFFQATWYYEWYSSAYYNLAQMESRRGNYAQALAFAQKAYSTNNNDGNITLLLSALLRRQGRKEEAFAPVDRMLKIDPINFPLIYEKELLHGRGDMQQWQRYMQDVDNNYIDIALPYSSAGLYNEAIGLLGSQSKPGNPLNLYWLAWLCRQQGDTARAKKLQIEANNMPIDYCFPYREEEQAVLAYSAAQPNNNASAQYLLGNLLYDRRPEEALDAWQKAVRMKANFPMVWRNLAFGAFYHQKNVEQAVEYMRKAIEQDGNHPLWYGELESYYDLSSLDFKECLAIMEQNIDAVKRDVTAPQRLVWLYNLNGEYDKAIALLKTQHFRTWEGGRDIYYHYVDAHTLKALSLMSSNPRAAIDELNAAMLYPENLEVGKPLNDERNAMMHCLIGLAWDKLGSAKKAKEAYNKSVAARNNGRWRDLEYYQGVAQAKLGRQKEATELFEKLINDGKSILEKGVASTGIGVEAASVQNKSLADGYYIQALGNKGLGNDEEANTLLRKALKEYKNHLWAKYFLD
ncbi:MAG: DUF5107 domain-containing protein [Prevotellaceae bacterium]|nr:DUF5107 domain-containing protein [Prevotellaceae bacterium]